MGDEGFDKRGGVPKRRNDLKGGSHLSIRIESTIRIEDEVPQKPKRGII